MSEDANPNDEPKIIVDDDWKSQVEKEKEALKEQAEQEEPPVADAMPHELPPASFLVLLSTLATQAMAALGIFPDPMTGKPTVNRPMAKHFIDTLSMLKEKTSGNLTEEESAHLRDALHQLRMQFISSANQPDSPPAEPEATSSNIELP